MERLASTNKEPFVPGQRWSSDSEPELGLGIILEVGVREVKIAFRAAGTVRTYMHRNAPLRRVRLKAGDRARSGAGRAFVIRDVKEAGGLIVYLGEGEALPEQDLLDQMAFSDPDKRLLAGQVGKPREFSLRYRTHQFRKDMLGSRVRGLIGARMELLEHQISIAHEVASRHDPKVLLADEVGLGKTIEAGLVYHRLHVTGQIDRVLVVVPSQLVHQWLVELYRRFNQMFTVMEEDLCRSEEKGDASVNPFMGRQTMICAVDFLSGTPRRAKQAAEAGIDLLIVDEAHHLGWGPESKSAEYAAVEALAKVSRAVLLLTATPIQLGQAGHFGRLRLLDPARFTDLGSYLQDAARYQELAATVDAILASEGPDDGAMDALLAAFPVDAALHAKIREYRQGLRGSKQGLIEDLVDRHGTGRLMFRNRRQAMGGFPARVVHAVALENPEEHREWARAVAGPDPKTGEGPFRSEAEFVRFLNGPAAYGSGEMRAPAPPQATDDGSEAAAFDGADFLKRAWRKDPRLPWLVGLLKSLEGEKVLLICSHKAVVFALQEILPTLTGATFAAFHENLTMATRDKNAAYFATPEGAQMLICSEIGSEGRNFQFAHHLVLFDLPLDPSVLEQRIGRLDRIGQRHDIHIHVPYAKGTAHEVMFRWYHEGMDAFRSPVLGSDYFHAEQLGEVMEACRQAVASELSGLGLPPGQVEGLIGNTRALAAKVRETLEKGRDRLLEINSNRPELSRGLIAEMQAKDADDELEGYLEEVFDHFGVDSEATEARRGYFLFPGDRMEVDFFPALPAAGMAVTYDRREALEREDLAFLTMDHPLVRGAVDLILGSSEGTVGFVEWREAPSKGFAADAVFVLEATAPGHLHLDRFLAPCPIRVLVDATGEDLSHLLPRLDASEVEQAPTGLLEEHHGQFERMMPKLLEAAGRKASLKESVLKKEAHREAEKRLGAERDRLRDLMGVNPSVTKADVDAAEGLLKSVLGHIMAAEVRLDAVRMVILGRMPGL